MYVGAIDSALALQSTDLVVYAMASNIRMHNSAQIIYDGDVFIIYHSI